MKLLRIEGEDGAASGLDRLLADLGHEVRIEPAPAAWEWVRARRVDAVLCPLAADPPLLEEVRRRSPQLPLIAYGEDATALAAGRAFARGALGYVALSTGGELSRDMAEVLEDLLARAAARARVEAERVEVLRENQRLSKFYADVIDSVRQGIVVIDHEGRIRLRNPVAAQILGESDVAGRLDGSAAPKLLALLVETLSSGETQADTIAYEAEEQRVVLDVSASVLRGADGKAAGAVAVVADRSTERLLERQLVHQERLATLGSLLASIAHEINNTLTSVTGCAEMGLELAETAEKAADDAPPGPARDQLRELGAEIRMIFDMVLDAGISAQTIANNMLQYSRQGPTSHRVRESVNRLIEKTIGLMGKHLGTDKVELDLALDPSQPQVRIEPAKLQQGLINLIVNAVHALMEVEPERRRLRVSTGTEGDYVVIAVTDEGPGIPAARLERIWKPFFTTKGHGTGLGLYITRRVIEELGGRIECESEVGAGTCFKVHLPLDRGTLPAER
ncbi:MAG: PAS domain-containing protein [Planctomycetota bacterium]|nr:MAG: PAS domain-containing protein [Planctomycetota bacterium]